MVRLIQQPTGSIDLLDQYRQSGSPDLFAQIMRAYGGMVLSVCYKVTKDAADAEDASQATFLTLAVQCKTGAPIQYLGPWLKKVAKRTSLDLVRSRKRRTRRETVTAENRPEHYNVKPAAQPEADELSLIIKAELEELPPKYKMPLVLHYFGGLSHEQISKEMNCTTAALGVRLHRARKMLGKRLSARGVTLEGTALGAAVAVAVHHAMAGRFFASPHAVALGLASAHTLPMTMTAGVPEHLLSVLQVVHDVGHSMARARMRMATAALAASISILGGAAEAVRHLPDSLRPNFDFLSPRKLLNDWFSVPVPTPHFQGPLITPSLAKAPEINEGGPIAFATVAPLAAPPAAVNQPLLALQLPYTVPAPAPAATTALPRLTLTTIAQPRTAAGITLTTTAAVGGDARPRSVDGGLHLAAGGGAAASAESTASVARTSGLSMGTPMGNAEPDAGRGDANFPHDAPLAGFQGSAVGGETVEHPAVATPVVLRGIAGPNAITGSEVPDSVILRAGDVFVHSGSGHYQWSDPPYGIDVAKTNAVDFTLAGATGDGLIALDRLPTTTTLAPVRPTGHHFVDLWSIDSSVDYSSIALTAHYDNTLAESLGLPENVLKLWVYDDGAWTRITDDSFSRDLIDHTLSGTFVGMPTYIAVSAPEPTGMLCVLGVAGVGLVRRRRRAS